MNTAIMADTERKNENKTTNNEEKPNNKPETTASFNEFQRQNLYTQFSTENNGEYPPNQESQYRNMREYATVLHCWLWQYRMMAAVGTFQTQMLSSVAQNATSFQRGTQFNPVNRQMPNVSLGQQQVSGAGSPGVQYKIPMLWRRVVAEFLDFVLLFYTKILVTVAVLRQMGFMNEDILMELDTQFPFLSDISEFDYDKMFTLTSELIALEIINRVCITIVETMCIRKGYAGSVGGATPGKKIMQLRVISFSDIREVRNGYVTVIGASDPGFFNALIRSIIKNFSMAFFFPACFTVFFFRFNRAAYDVLAQTMVVEVEHRRRDEAQ